MCIHFMGKQFTFSALTFQPKQFSSAYLYGVQKMADPSFQYNKKVIAQNTIYSLVSANLLPFFIDFQADRPATLIFLRDHRG